MTILYLKCVYQISQCVSSLSHPHTLNIKHKITWFFIQHTCDLRIQCTGVTSLLHLQYLFDPCYNLVRTGIRGLIEIDKTSFHVFFYVAVQRRGTMCQRCVVVGSDVKLVKILKQQWPLGCLQFGNFWRWLYLKLILFLQSAKIFAIDGLLLDLLLFLPRVYNNLMNPLYLRQADIIFRILTYQHQPYLFILI